MATKKKGCGFLIAALVLLILGGVIAGILGKDAFSTGKEFTESMSNGSTFIAPNTIDYTSDVDQEVTVWSQTATNISTVQIEVTDTASGTTSMAKKPTGSSNMNGQNLVATFKVTKGITYKIKANGAEDGQGFAISTVGFSEVMSMVGKGAGAFGAFGVCGFIALILGIIGLVKFFSSKGGTPPIPQP